jgi:hypothetical protein
MLNPLLSAAALMLLLAGPARTVGDAPRPAPSWDRAAAMMQHVTVLVPRITVTTTTIVTRERVVPNPPVSARSPRRMAPPPPMLYREKKADDCVKMRKIRGFLVNTPDSIDLLVDEGPPLRARLGSNCPALGFYAGFYVKPNADGKMCARRDVIRSRMGKTCGIDQFRKLVPAK